ncbi:MAG: hypothetical protein ACFFED_12305 [Candidatus Thorarchaeota archaeon]
MQGSKNAALLFLLSSIMLFVQASVSSIVLDDWLGAFVAGSFGFVMLLALGMAYKGGLSAVVQSTTVDGPGYRTTYYRDTGQRIQATPCCGICGGIGIFIAILMLAGDVFGDLFLALIPGILAGILSILAGIVFAIEYKGPWTGQVY